MISIMDRIAAWRERFPDGLICIRCAQLIATQRTSYHLSEPARLEYVCAGCRRAKRS